MSDDDMEMIGARIPSRLNRTLEEYCNDLGIRKSEAIRRLLQEGLEERGHEPTAISLGVFFAVAGLGMLLGASIDPASLALRIAGLFIVLGTLIEYSPRLKAVISDRF